MEFQAETRKLLDIVTNSIYTDKEVFVRELISNASDALEKYRFLQSTGSISSTAESSAGPLEINIVTDSTNGTLTICDNGIGMSRDELVSNLGTIARSGTKNFVEQQQKQNNGAADGIIGQFGVGFYSSFMVSDTVSVDSIPAVLTSAEAASAKPSPTRWRSDGSGLFTVEQVEESAVESLGSHGSKIEMTLKEDCKDFADPDKIKR